jgi:CRP/FNR family transcriptional regulator
MARDDIHTAGIPVLCRSCEVRHRGICGALEPAELTALARHTHKARHEAGATLTADGTEIASYANVMAGVVKLSKVLEDGREQVVGLQFAPDFLGRIFGRENAMNAEAASDVELCVMPRAALERMMTETPQLERRLMQQALRELDEAREWMVTLGRKTASERVASFLHRIAAHADPAAGGKDATFILPLTREEIGDFLGLTLETVSRQLSRLKTSGVIAMEGPRVIRVPHLAALKALCG